MVLPHISTHFSLLSLGLLVWLSCCHTNNIRTSAQTCRPRPNGDLSHLPKDHGALNVLLASANMTRETIVHQELPYNTIRNEIGRQYNTTKFNVSPFVEEWVKYTQNVLFLAGFIAFVGVVFPLVMVVLWIVWEFCYDAGESEIEEYKNESCCAQIVAWSLSVGVFVLLVGLVAFMALLLEGNSLVNRGVFEGGVAVSKLLPQTEKIRDQSVHGVEVTVLGGYERLSQDVYNILRDIPSNIKSNVSGLLNDDLQMFYSNVSRQFSLYPQLLNHSQLLLSRSHSLSVANDDAESSDISQLLSSFNSTFQQLQSVCSMLPMNQNLSNLNNECSDFINPQGNRYIPVIRNLGLRNNVDLLQMMVDILTNKEFFMNVTINTTSLYFEEMSENLTRLSHLSTDGFLGNESAFYHNLTSVVREVHHFNSSLSFGLPASQNELLTYLHERYLANWNEFRSICTITFVLIILILGACLVLSIGRGLFNIYELHVHGDDPSNLEGAHQSGKTIRKLALMLTGVCLVSAIFHGVSLVIASGLGQGCGPNRNFSELLEMVIDDSRTWRGNYLLGQAIHANGSYPLTFKNLLDNCQQNQSLYWALRLADRFNFEQDIYISAEAMEAYRTSLRDLSQTISPFLSLTPCAHSQLELLATAESLPVVWGTFTSLTLNSSQLFTSGFVGLKGVMNKLDSMHLALMNVSSHLPSPEVGHALSLLINRTSDVLSNLTAHLNTSLLSIRDSADFLQTVQRANSSSLLRVKEDSLQKSVKLHVSRGANIYLVVGATTIKANISDYISNTTNSLICETGSCHFIPELYDQFSSALCQDVVPGLDLYWVSLMGILAFALCIMILSLFLASRFMDLALEKSSRGSKFHLTSSVIRQTRAILWLALGLAMNSWLVVAISKDTHFHSIFCSEASAGGCCSVCVWIFGIVFLVLSLIVGGVSRVYQCIILHRLSKCVKKVRRYWVDKKKAVQFHGQLAILIIQDFPFLILAGIYTSRTGILTIPAFFSLTVSLLGIISYLLYIFTERNSIRNYFICLKNEFRRSSKFNVQGEHSPNASNQGVNGQAIAMNGRVVNGRYISSESEQSESDSQGTTQRVDDWMYDPHNNAISHGEHRLSVIPEHTEGMENSPPRHLSANSSPPGSPLAGGVAMTVPVYMHQQPESDSETLPTASMRLDRTDSPSESALRQRREAAHRDGLGIEVASSIRHYDTSSVSYFGSKTSVGGSDIQGYYSSSQPPDELYESSDYREDYDSDYSHTNAQRNKLRLQLNSYPCEMSVEV